MKQIHLRSRILRKSYSFLTPVKLSTLKYLLISSHEKLIIHLSMRSRTTSLLCFLFLLSFKVEGNDVCGPDCCKYKVVGNYSYTLSHKDQHVPDSCKNGCVYTRDGEEGTLYCFAPGSLPGQCLNEAANEVPEAITTTDVIMENGETFEQTTTYHPGSHEVIIRVPAHGDNSGLAVILSKHIMVHVYPNYCQIRNEI